MTCSFECILIEITLLLRGRTFYSHHKKKNPGLEDRPGFYFNMLLNRLYSTSSKSWISRQAKDPYCKLAKANQYRARSAFKLIQINEKYRLIHRNDVVVDCGAAPGGWTQVAAELISAKGLVIGIDLLPVDPIPNAHIIKGNFMRIRTQNAIREILDGRSVNLVCSDMAPSFSGNHTADHARSMELCESALTFAEKVLQPGGSFVAKVTYYLQIKKKKDDILITEYYSF